MKKVYKKLIYLVAITILFNSFSFASLKDNTPQVDETRKVYDFADLFTLSEEESLYQDIIEFININKMDMAVVTIDDNNKLSSMDYADDFYDYNNFGIGSTYDGLLFLIDMDNREMWISTTGEAQRVYDDYRIEKILDKTYSKISDEDYFGCASIFIDRSGYYARLGVPDSNKNTYIDESGDYIVGSEDDFFVILIACWITAIIPSIIVTVIFMAIALSKHKMIKKKTHAGAYLETINITNRQDVFLTTHTSSTYIGSSSYSGGGSRGGGSSTHRSSSGRSHGGGGRRF